MKRVLSIITILALVLTLSAVPASAGNGNGKGNGQNEAKQAAKEFKDMKGHWGNDSVKKVQSARIIEGYSDGTFQPDSAITQAELAVIIERLLAARVDFDDDDDSDIDDDEDIDEDKDADDDEELSDVPGWAEKAVQKGFKNNYLNQKRFHSAVQCDRLLASVAIAKALGLEPVTDVNENPFGDSKLISDEDYGYLLALYKAGYIKGYPDGNFNPNKLITRAQIAAIIEKLLGEDLPSADKTAPTWDGDSEVTAEDIQATSVTLEWSGAEDDVKVVGYKVSYELDDVNKVKYISGKTATISGLEADEEYSFAVEARDAAGNWSDDGPSVTVTTLEVVEDTTEPKWSDDSLVTATAIRAHSVDLKWSGASDNVKIVAFKIIYEYDDIEKIKYTYNTTEVRASDLVAGEKYTFTIEAKDAAGNWSDDGPSVIVTTLEEEVKDTAVPTWQSNAALTFSSTETGTVTVAWPDAEDNTGVKTYKIYKDGQLIKTVDSEANNAAVTGLSADTEYTFKVRAVDEAGNISVSLSADYLAE